MQNPTDDNRAETKGLPTPAAESQATQAPDSEPEAGHTLAAGTRVLPMTSRRSAHLPSRMGSRA